MSQRSAFFVSDSTGITASALGKLLEHFPDTDFKQVRLSFTDTEEKVQAAKGRIAQAHEKDGFRPVVIMSVGNNELRQSLKQANAYFIDLFSLFIDPLGEELQQTPLTGTG
ncbi:MAG: kinase/pyrophosphorylase, partial [Methylophilaceae bacterium]